MWWKLLIGFFFLRKVSAPSSSGVSATQLVANPDVQAQPGMLDGAPQSAPRFQNYIPINTPETFSNLPLQVPMTATEPGMGAQKIMSPQRPSDASPWRYDI
jgi:hypothetical protein